MAPVYGKSIEGIRYQKGKSTMKLPIPTINMVKLNSMVSPLELKNPAKPIIICTLTISKDMFCVSDWNGNVMETCQTAGSYSTGNIGTVENMRYWYWYWYWYCFWKYQVLVLVLISFLNIVSIGIGIDILFENCQYWYWYWYWLWKSLELISILIS